MAYIRRCKPQRGKASCLFIKFFLDKIDEFRDRARHRLRFVDESIICGQFGIEGLEDDVGRVIEGNGALDAQRRADLAVYEHGGIV